MPTLTLLLDNENDAAAMRAALVSRGITDADILTFAGPDCDESLASVLANLHPDPADRDAKTRHVHDGGALVAVRVSDETHDLVRQVLEGSPLEPGSVDPEAQTPPPPARDADDPGPQANLTDIDGQETKMSSSQ